MISLEERMDRLESLFSRISSEISSSIRVSLPCKIISFDSNKQTVSCIPLIRELVNINGTVSYKELPELRDVPIVMPRAGNWSITFPIKEGDECLVIFQDLCIDGWWFRGGIQNWNDIRRHDLSDAIAIFSPWSQPNTIPSYSTSSMDIRSKDGSIKISLSENGVTMNFPQGYTINGNGTFNGNLNIKGNIDQKGNLEVDGKIHATGDIESDNNIKGTVEVVAKNTIHLSVHTHGNVQPGQGNTGGPQG